MSRADNSEFNNVTLVNDKKFVEYHSEEEMLENSKQKKTSVKLSSVFATFAAVLVVGSAYLIGGTATANADIDELLSTDTEIRYVVTVKEGEDMGIYLYNDFINRSYELENGENDGVFENLKPGMEYTVEIKDKDGSTVEKQKIRTKRS